MANENRAYQLITEYHEEQRKLTIHREVDDEKTLTSYLHQIEALEASFEARLALWREERECLDTALSDAKQRFKKAQEEIHEIEQTLSLVSKREEKLQQNLRDEQERLVDGWTKSGHETFLERPRVDFDRCCTLIGNLKRTLEERADECRPSKRQRLGYENVPPGNRAEGDGKDILHDLMSSTSPKQE